MEAIVAGGTNFKGQVDNAAALPQEGNKPGDIYQTTDDNKNYIWDGDEWKEYGSSPTLTNDLINTNQFEILEGKLNLKEVDAGNITIPSDEPDGEGEDLKTVITEMKGNISTNTSNIATVQAAIEWQNME